MRAYKTLSPDEKIERFLEAVDISVDVSRSVLSSK